MTSVGQIVRSTYWRNLIFSVTIESIPWSGSQDERMKRNRNCERNTKWNVPEYFVTEASSDR